MTQEESPQREQDNPEKCLGGHFTWPERPTADHRAGDPPCRIDQQGQLV